MESNKKITISFRNEKEKVPENEIIQAKEEVAASDPDPNKIEEIPVLEIRKPHPSPTKKKKYEKNSVKYLVVAASSALLLSLGLGFLLLRMFVTLTDETTAGKEMVPAAVPSEEAVTEQVAAVNPNAVEAYLVQAGVFTTEEKAFQWKSKLTALSVSSMVWERDHQFYLFAGSAQTETEASQIAAELSSRSIETYVKPWSVLKGEGSLTGEEAKTFDLLIDHLENFSIDQLSDADRQKLLSTLEKQEPNSPLISALQGWDQRDNYHLNWLKVAYSLEKMME